MILANYCLAVCLRYCPASGLTLTQGPKHPGENNIVGLMGPSDLAVSIVPFNYPFSRDSGTGGRSQVRQVRPRCWPNPPKPPCVTSKLPKVICNILLCIPELSFYLSPNILAFLSVTSSAFFALRGASDSFPRTAYFTAPPAAGMLFAKLFLLANARVANLMASL